jgi:hypothetical protein
MSQNSYGRVRQQLRDIDSLFRTNSPVKEVEIIYNEMDKNCDVHSINGNRRKSTDSIKSMSRRRGSMSSTLFGGERRDSFPEFLEKYSIIENDEYIGSYDASSFADILESKISSSPRHKSVEREDISRANNNKKTTDTKNWNKRSSISTSNVNNIKSKSIDHPSKFPDMLRSTSTNDISRRSSWSYLPNTNRKASLPLNNKHSNISLSSLKSPESHSPSKFKLNLNNSPTNNNNNNNRRDSYSDSSNSSNGLRNFHNKYSIPRRISIDSLNSSSTRRSSRKISDFGLSDDDHENNKIRLYDSNSHQVSCCCLTQSLTDAILDC